MEGDGCSDDSSSCSSNRSSRSSHDADNNLCVQIQNVQNKINRLHAGMTPASASKENRPNYAKILSDIMDPERD
ncbi:hypothetical protein HNY73_011544 [Argiope bruennichi]|uniref:Uncharacterized protein n=1 Tax=Argiope bruennichi TaxID=94029 RepID=A0A8T0F1N8_ARGBR|nr:hypothetical protein HNY73_011544 [Argiope bruennichi]